MRVCKHCNNEIDENSKFCTKCGATVDVSTIDDVTVDDATVENKKDSEEVVAEKPVVEKQKGGKKKWIILASLAACLVVIAIVLFSFSDEINNLFKPKIVEPTISSTSDSNGLSIVTLNNPNNFGIIYYTIDESEPLAKSKKYEEAITLDRTVNLKARVIDDEDNMSNIVSQQFTIIEKIVQIPVESQVNSGSFGINIPEEYHGTWVSSKGDESFTFSVNSYIYRSAKGQGHSGTIARIDKYNNSMALELYPSNSTGSFTIDPEKPRDNLIKIDGVTYAFQN